MLEIIIYILLALVSLTGLVLVAINLPGIWLIYISTVVLAIMDKFENLTPLVLVILFLLCLLSTLSDNIATALGAKKMGGSGWGIAGAIIGGLIGMLAGGIAGMFLGPLFGATIFEIIFAHKNATQGVKAGFGTFIGIIFSIIFKFSLSVGIIIFTVSRIVN
mgnify:CR=1 FL=1